MREDKKSSAPRFAGRCFICDQNDGLEQIVPKLAGATRVPQPPQGLAFDLANAFAGQAKLLPDLL